MTSHGRLHQLAFFPRIFPVNCYLVEEEDNLTLVDTGLSYSCRFILGAAKKRNKPIKRIVITHAHSDHVASLDHLAKALPNASIYLPRRELKLLHGDRTLLPTEPQAPVKGGFITKIRTRPDYLLKEGDYVGSLRVIPLPGHTPGMIGLFDERDRTLIASDAFQTQGGVYAAGDTCWRFPFPSFATWHLPTSLDSARKAAALEPELLAVGHGRLLHRPGEAMKKAVQRLEKKASLRLEEF
ncbi:MBL fold metallo-hydrolase [Alkalicoccus chagannorensis]|uniref:MBL fold metallo-hydrolase n=1 Tax=Alkalicoccus chagannorensis TaxID=427072 RepID=UPI0039F10023